VRTRACCRSGQTPPSAAVVEDAEGSLVAVSLAASAAVATWVAVLRTWAAVVVAVAVGVESAGAAAAALELGGSLVVAGGGSLVVVVVGGAVVVVLGGGVVVGGTVVDGDGALVVGDGLVVVGDGFVVALGPLVVGEGRLVVGVPVAVPGLAVVGLVVGVEDGGRPPVLLGVVDTWLASVIGTSPSATVRIVRLPGSSTRCGTTAYGTDAVADGAKPRYGAGST
jgi:hypothetical protein